MGGMIEQRTINGKLLGGITGKGFLPGQSGNPAGRPPNSVTTLLKNRSDEDNQAFADMLWELAMSGDMPAIREVLDRKEGKVPQAIDAQIQIATVTGDQLAMIVLDVLRNQKNLLESNQTNEIIEGIVTELPVSLVTETVPSST